MIYLFCSASTPLYKRDALESTCYPPGHFFRFRYRRTYVDPQILGSPESFQDKEGVIVFLDTIGHEDKSDFDFFPIRQVKTVRIFPEGRAIYVDFKFGDFINYGPVGDDLLKRNWTDFFSNLPNRPWPSREKSGRKKEDSEGYFLLCHTGDKPAFPTKSPVAHEGWENLILRLNSTHDLQDSTFFQVLGFYRAQKSCSLGRSYEEILISPQDNCYDSVYPLPMGESVVLKLLFSRPTFDPKMPTSRRIFELQYGSDVFAGASKNQIHSDSRYNEERIILVCKRVYDSFLSRISLEQDGELTVQSPRPFLLVTLKIPRLIVFLVVFGVFLSTLLIALDADSMKFIGTTLQPNHADFWEKNAKVLSTIGKALSTIPISISAYLAFRRLPIK